jgi:hypothetical protein
VINVSSVVTVPGESVEDREARIDATLHEFGDRLIKREDGFYHVAHDADGSLSAPNGWRVRTWDLNDRGGEVSSPYPLTLAEIDLWLQGG